MPSKKDSLSRSGQGTEEPVTPKLLRELYHINTTLASQGVNNTQAVLEIEGQLNFSLFINTHVRVQQQVRACDVLTVPVEQNHTTRTIPFCTSRSTFRSYRIRRLFKCSATYPMTLLMLTQPARLRSTSSS